MIAFLLMDCCCVWMCVSLRFERVFNRSKRMSGGWDNCVESCPFQCYVWLWRGRFSEQIFMVGRNCKVRHCHCWWRKTKWSVMSTGEIKTMYHMLIDNISSTLHGCHKPVSHMLSCVVLISYRTWLFHPSFLFFLPLSFQPIHPNVAISSFELNTDAFQLLKSLCNSSSNALHCTSPKYSPTSLCSSRTPLVTHMAFTLYKCTNVDADTYISIANDAVDAIFLMEGDCISRVNDFQCSKCSLLNKIVIMTLLAKRFQPTVQLMHHFCTVWHEK